MKTYFSFFIDCLRPRWKSFLVLLAALAAFNATDLLLTKWLQFFIDSVAGTPVTVCGISLPQLSTMRGRLIVFPGGLLMLALLRWWVSYRRTLIQTRLGQGTLFDLRRRIYDTMQSLSFAYHDHSHRGRLIANLVEDISHVAHFFERGAFPLLEHLLYVIFTWAAMWWVCKEAGLVSIATMFFGFVMLYFFFRRGRVLAAKRRLALEGMVESFSESMEGQNLVRAFGAHERRAETYERQVDELHRYEFRERALFSFLNQSLLLPAVFGLVLVMATALMLMRQGVSLSAGQLFFLFSLQNTLIGRMRILSRMCDQWLQFTVSVERLNELFQADERLSDQGCPIPTDSDELTLKARNLSFGYRNGPDSLSKVDVTIRAGETIGLVGAAGSGKSTLALLLCRFYDPAEGQMLLNDRSLGDFAVRDLRQNFALVFQDSFLFSTTIRENIAYGRPDAPLEEIIHAASHAQAHEFIMEFPDGYDTLVGENGVTLSGGQRQRLSIARALLRRPAFLVLDDCTSALDVATEQAIQEALREFAPRTAKIIIAHRYASIAEADRVYVLENGTVIECGTPQELNRPDSHFRRILQIDSSAPREEKS